MVYKITKQLGYNKNKSSLNLLDFREEIGKQVGCKAKGKKKMC